MEAQKPCLEADILLFTANKAGLSEQNVLLSGTALSVRGVSFFLSGFI
jgi:hypothetical protein